jgi:ATP-binding cassette subfamily F protein 3
VIKITDLILRRGTKVLLDRTSVVLQPGERIGLVGANGAGKSSLFALLRGELGADQGEYSFPKNWRMTHVAQETASSERSALDHVIDGDTHLRQLEAAIALAEDQYAHDHADAKAHDELGHQLGTLHAQFGDADGYTVKSRAETLLLGLGFSLEETQQPVASFSGGWRMRLNLAQALMRPSDLMLLDEPTNHLDLDAIVWLEQWLKRYAGTLVVISHDREFLDSVCNVILHIENQGLKRYTGNYTAFERLRAEQIKLTQFAFDKQQREIAHLQKFVDRFKALASKAKQAQSRVKALERMDMISPTHASSPFTFRFREPDAAPDPMLVIDDLVCGYAYEDETGMHTKRILNKVKLTLRNGERIGLLGANGQGKSTFIKTVAGAQPLLGGTMLAGKGLKIGYFAQHQVDILRLDQTPLQQLAMIAPNVREQELRNYLGSFDFRDAMATANVAPFSGGEKARLALALIIWQKPNLLLLDEPTNHLDLETREALTIALAQFEGALILVAHDRALLRATTDEFLLVANGGVKEFDGDLDDYRDWLLAKSAKDAKPVDSAAKVEAAKPAPSAAAAAASASKASEPRLSEADKRDKKKLDANARNAQSQQRKPIESRIKRIEEQLAKLGLRKAAIEKSMSDPEIYSDAQKDALRQLLIDQAYVGKEMAQFEAEWLEQQDLLEKLAA